MYDIKRCMFKGLFMFFFFFTTARAIVEEKGFMLHAVVKCVLKFNKNVKKKKTLNM